MTDSRLDAALDRGALVVTPNNRLARDFVAEHDRRQRVAGRTVWPTARVVPWNAFVGELWQAALDAGVTGFPTLGLDPGQAAFLWRRVVERDLRDAPLVDATAAAELAAEAWERVHAFGEGGASWRGFASGGGDVAAFVRWADAFEQETARESALDPARAADALCMVPGALRDATLLDVACVGFLEYSPQQRRLFAALARAGARVDAGPEDPDESLAPGARLLRTATPRDELLASLAWARNRAAADPTARIGIVVHDLAQSRDAVRALAEDVLCPGLGWPGGETARRPYDISAGAALDATPVVAAALDLLALTSGPLDVGRAAALLRSRHLPGDAAMRARRAVLARGWLDLGRREVGLRALVADLADADPALATRWQALVKLAPPARATPRGHADFWRRWLDTAGWCDGTAVAPAEREARGAWVELLVGFGRLGAVASRLSRSEALDALRSAARAQPFQPEAPGARIRILGLLEAAGLSFDALWIAGLTADVWPRAAEPNPLLPYAWQRERGVPRATPAREMAYARRLTATLSRGAPEVVFSCAERIDDHPVLPSPLIKALLPYEDAIVRPRLPAREAFAVRPAADRVIDSRAPAWPEGVPFSGGASLVDAQSACPFQATARHRLRAETWPEEVPGLPPQERGKLVHAALAAFWRGVQDHASLVALSPGGLDARVEAAVAAGRAAVDAVRWAALPPVVAAAELACTARLLRDWLAIERDRPPFRVLALEQETRVTLAGHALRLRIDRVDQLPDGQVVIIDYKTGTIVTPARWFDARPQGPQLALYAMAEAVADQPLAGLAYAQLKPGRLKVGGIASDAGVWPALADAGATGAASWDDATARLREGVEALAAGIGVGDARIAPRDARACTWCGLKALCRIAGQEENGDDGDDEEVGGDGDG